MILWLTIDDPNFRTQRFKHREFIFCKSKLLEVVPFRYTPELLNIVVFTYRLEYVRECVLFPYLNDNGFGSSGCVDHFNIKIIRNNYKKIFNHIFSNKRKDFINSLYDLLRMQNVQAFKLLRELFRIARVHYVYDEWIRCRRFIIRLPKKIPFRYLLTWWGNFRRVVLRIIARRRRSLRNWRRLSWFVLKFWSSIWSTNHITLESFVCQKVKK